VSRQGIAVLKEPNKAAPGGGGGPLPGASVPAIRNSKGGVASLSQCIHYSFRCMQDDSYKLLAPTRYLRKSGLAVAGGPDRDYALNLDRICLAV